MKLSAEDQLAVLIRARQLLARPGGWKGGRPTSATRMREPLTLGEACQQAAFELNLIRQKRNGAYTVALATGLLKHTAKYGHKSLAGFNDAPETWKKDVLGLIDSRMVELM